MRRFVRDLSGVAKLIAGPTTRTTAR